jgi:hypothetical protein
MSMKKNIISTAVTTALGIGLSGAASAAAVSQFVVEDVGSTLNGVNGGGVGTYSTALDGNSGGFRFGNINPTLYKSAVGWTGDVGAGAVLAEGNANATGSFTTGFIFSSTPFVPFTFGSGVNADIDGANNLTFSSLDWGGNFQAGAGTNFLLPPDAGTLQVNWTEDGASASEKLVSFQWSHLITTAEDSTGNFTGFNARWIVEGTATVVPVPAAVWLFGSGILGLVAVARRRKGSKV